ncbi:MAG: hypothetical protein ACKVH8_11470 [Pirellulales bacterium]
MNLRPHAWVDINFAAVSTSAQLDLSELGAQGYAKVKFIGSCPKIQ